MTTAELLHELETSAFRKRLKRDAFPKAVRILENSDWFPCQMDYQKVYRAYLNWKLSAEFILNSAKAKEASLLAFVYQPCEGDTKAQADTKKRMRAEAMTIHTVIAVQTGFLSRLEEMMADYESKIREIMQGTTGPMWKIFDSLFLQGKSVAQTAEELGYAEKYIENIKCKLNREIRATEVPLPKIW